MVAKAIFLFNEQVKIQKYRLNDSRHLFIDLKYSLADGMIKAAIIDLHSSRTLPNRRAQLIPISLNVHLGLDLFIAYCPGVDLKVKCIRNVRDPMRLETLRREPMDTDEIN